MTFDISEYLEQLVYEMVDDGLEKEAIIKAFKDFDLEDCIDIAIDDKLNS